MADVREANINVVGNWQTPIFGDFNERAISLVEVREAVNEMKSGKDPGLDGFLVECLKKGGMAVLESWFKNNTRLTRSFNPNKKKSVRRRHCQSEKWRSFSVVSDYLQKCIRLLLFLT